MHSTSLAHSTVAAFCLDSLIDGMYRYHLFKVPNSWQAEMVAGKLGMLAAPLVVELILNSTDPDPFLTFKKKKKVFIRDAPIPILVLNIGQGTDL